MKVRTYIRIDGRWYQTYRQADGWDVVCWCCVAVIAAGLIWAIYS